MRSKEELDAIALKWASNSLQDWQNEYTSWDCLEMEYDLDEDELSYLMDSVAFEVKIK